MAREFHPTGQVTFNFSIMVDADNFKWAGDNQGKLLASLADRDGIPVTGMRSVNCTFDLRITNEGPEVAVMSLMNEGAIVDVGFKFPGNDVNLNAKGILSKVDAGQTLGDAFVLNVSFMGKTTNLQNI